MPSDRPADGPGSLLDQLSAWIWAAFVAASPGWVSYVLTRAEPVALLSKNEGGDPRAALLHLLIGGLLTAVLWVWLARRLRARDSSLSARAAWSRAVMATRLLLLGPIGLSLHMLAPPSVNGPLPAALILAGAALVSVSVGSWPALPPGWRRRIAAVFGGSRGSTMILLVGAGVIGSLLVRLAFWRHYSFNTRAFDLGIYDNIVWNTSHGDFLACSLVRGGVHTSAHFDPILGLFSLGYALVPGPETLIVLQAIWVLSGVIPVYLLAKRRLDDRVAATILGLGFAAYPSLHGLLVHDFHSLTLLVTPALWMLWCLDARRALGYWLAVAVALSTREDASLFVVGVGAYALLATDSRRRGALTIVVALVYLAVVKLAVMPDAALLMQSSDETYAYANRYRGLIPTGGGASDGLATLLTNPGFVLVHVLTWSKAAAALGFLAPLGLLPLVAGRRLLLALYGAAFTLLGTHPPLYSPLAHYSSVLFPALFAAVPEGVARVQAWLVDARGHSPARARALVLVYLATSLSLGSLAMGGLVDTASFQTLTRVRGLDARQSELYGAFRAAIAVIPPEASVTASNRTAPHLSSRRELYIVQQRVEAEWLVVHRDDLQGADSAWVAGLIKRRRYVQVGRGPGWFSVLRRVEPSP